MTISNQNDARKPDFKRVYQKANELLVCSSAIQELPFKTKDLVKEQSDITLCSFKKASSKYHQDRKHSCTGRILFGEISCKIRT